MKLPYDDIDLQHQMLQHHWYVSGYKMSFHDPTDEATKALFTDAPKDRTMFRVVVKANVTRPMMDNLVTALHSCVAGSGSGIGKVWGSGMWVASDGCASAGVEALDPSCNRGMLL